jgi:hypothetical protein
METEAFAGGGPGGEPARAREGRLAGGLAVLDAAAFYRLNRTSNRVHACSAVVRTEAHKVLGGYLPSLPHAGDYELWLRLSAHGPVGYIPRFQVAARRHRASMSAGYDPTADILQRAAALEAVRASCAPALPAGLLEDLCACLASEALRTTTLPLRRGARDDVLRLVAAARTLDPAITRRPDWAVYLVKRALGPQLWGLLRGLLRGRPPDSRAGQARGAPRAQRGQ